MTHADIYETITAQIIEAIEAGCDSWRMPWHITGESTFSPVNVDSGRKYRGINLISLWASATRNRFSCGTWGTFRQWKAIGANVRKGQRATTVVFWRIADRDEGPREEATEAKPSPVTAPRHDVYGIGYSVFNADQVEGHTRPEQPALSESERNADAEAFFRYVPADVRPGGGTAFYSPTQDYIAIPRFEDFKAPARYYGVLAHELTHWSGAPNRLARDLSGRFGSQRYAAEELIAELGAAFLCSGLGLQLSARHDHAPYISHWLDLLRSDKRAIFTAASRAQQAVDYLLATHQAGVRDAA